MTWLVPIALAAGLLVLAALFTLRRWLRRVSQPTGEAGLVDELDAGLAIPMRDSDTRRHSGRRPEVSHPAGAGNLTTPR